MATPKDEPEVYLVTPDGLRSPDQLKDEAGMTTRTQCCGERLREAPGDWICTVHGGGLVRGADWACDSCGYGYCGDCLKDL